MDLFVLKDLAGQSAVSDRQMPCGPQHGHYWLSRRLAVFSLKAKAQEGPGRPRPLRRRRGRGLLRLRGRRRSA